MGLGHQVRRRAFITVLAGATAWRLAGQAQQSEPLRRVGWLMAFPENDLRTQAYVTSFAQALGSLGWVEGKNIRIDYRFAAGDPMLFKSYAAELVGLSPNAILATTTPGGRGAAATNAHDTDRFRISGRSRRARVGSEPLAAWRQHHRVQFL